MYMRKKNRMTQTELGEKLGVSYMTVRRWETGKSKPKLDEMNKLAEIFGTTIEYFMGQAEEGQERETPTMAYWGGVLDNARTIALQGNSDDIEDVSHILRRALASLGSESRKTVAMA